MSVHYDRAGITLRHGDALDVLRGLFDLLEGDPA